MTDHDDPAPRDAEPPLPSCPDLPVEDLVAWLDGAISPESRPALAADRIAAHVAACPRCAREAELLRRSAELLARLPRRVASPGFGDRVLGAVRAEAATTAPDRPVTPAPLARVIPLRRWSAARRTVAAAAVLVVASGAWWMATSPGEPGRLSAREEEEIARDLYVLAHLDTLSEAEAEELASLADDLDAIEADADVEGDGG